MRSSSLLPSHLAIADVIEYGPRLPVLACAVQRRRFPVGASPTRQPLQLEAIEAIGAVMEVTKWLKPSISVSRVVDSASVQAATRVNVEQASGPAASLGDQGRGDQDVCLRYRFCGMMFLSPLGLLHGPCTGRCVVELPVVCVRVNGRERREHLGRGGICVLAKMSQNALPVAAKILLVPLVYR